MEPSRAPDVELRNQAAWASTKRGASIMDEKTGGKERRKPGESNVEEARLRQQAIGVKLRQMFDDVVNEPVPDDFLDILRQADNRNAGNTSGDRD
jgi:hypothetical protein